MIDLETTPMVPIPPPETRVGVPPVPEARTAPPPSAPPRRRRADRPGGPGHGSVSAGAARAAPAIGAGSRAEIERRAHSGARPGRRPSRRRRTRRRARARRPAAIWSARSRRTGARPRSRRSPPCARTTWWPTRACCSRAAISTPRAASSSRRGSAPPPTPARPRCWPRSASGRRTGRGRASSTRCSNRRPTPPTSCRASCSCSAGPCSPTAWATRARRRRCTASSRSSIRSALGARKALAELARARGDLPSAIQRLEEVLRLTPSDASGDLLDVRQRLGALNAELRRVGAGPSLPRAGGRAGSRPGARAGAAAGGLRPARHAGGGRPGVRAPGAALLRTVAPRGRPVSPGGDPALAPRQRGGGARRLPPLVGSGSPVRAGAPAPRRSLLERGRSGCRRGARRRSGDRPAAAGRRARSGRPARDRDDDVARRRHGALSVLPRAGGPGGARDRRGDGPPGAARRSRHRVARFDADPRADLGGGRRRSDDATQCCPTSSAKTRAAGRGDGARPVRRDAAAGWRSPSAAYGLAAFVVPECAAARHIPALAVCPARC